MNELILFNYKKEACCNMREGSAWRVRRYDGRRVLSGWHVLIGSSNITRLIYSNFNHFDHGHSGSFWPINGLVRYTSNDEFFFFVHFISAEILNFSEVIFVAHHISIPC